MLKRSLTAASLITALALLGAGCSQITPATPSAEAPNAPAVTTPATAQPNTTTITMTDEGFTPSQTTVKQGDTVKFVNNGSQPHWPASAPHPTHTNYPEFDPKTGIASGDSWSFTFTKVGSWPFHDHLTPSHFGKVTVTE